MANRKEFRISLPNQPGQLARVCEALGKRSINIRTVAGVAGAPVFVLVTEQVEQTGAAFQELGLSFQEVELLTAKLADKPGELATLAKKLADANINIESLYMFGASAGEVEIAFTVSDIGKAKQVLGL